MQAAGGSPPHDTGTCSLTAEGSQLGGRSFRWTSAAAELASGNPWLALTVLAAFHNSVVAFTAPFCYKLDLVYVEKVSFFLSPSPPIRSFSTPFTLLIQCWADIALLDLVQ